MSFPKQKFQFFWLHFQIPQRLRLTLELLKKEHAIVTLQTKDGTRSGGESEQNERKYLLQEKLKIIKRSRPQSDKTGEIKVPSY